MHLDNTLISLLLVLALSLFIPELFKKFRLPFLSIIIIAGAVFGPNGLHYVEHNETINFFGFLGMAFLMFMAGLETDITKIYHSKLKIFTMASLNALVPFLAGVAVTRLFGYDWTSSILIGIIFISSSVAIIVSALKEEKNISKETSQLILSAVMVTDIISLIALGFIFQSTNKMTFLPLPLYFLVLLFSIFALFKYIPILSQKLIKKRFFYDYGHERRLRFVLILLIAIISFFSLLGAHPIIASFLAGLSLSGAIIYEKSELLKSKINTIGYGLFIPVFFFVIGMDIDLSILKNFDLNNWIVMAIILSLIISKISSGYVAGKLVKLSNKDSLIFGTISITQLTTTLAVTYSAYSLNLIDSVLSTAVILLAIITTFLGPLLTSLVAKSKKLI